MLALDGILLENETDSAQVTLTIMPIVTVVGRGC